MVDAIIIVLVIILLFFALKGSLKHFKGESPCCGGGSGDSGKAKTKFLDGPVIGRKTLTIEGMHCEHCVNVYFRSVKRPKYVSSENHPVSCTGQSFPFTNTLRLPCSLTNCSTTQSRRSTPFSASISFSVTYGKKSCVLQLAAVPHLSPRRIHQSDLDGLRVLCA